MAGAALFLADPAHAWSPLRDAAGRVLRWGGAVTRIPVWHPREGQVGDPALVAAAAAWTREGAVGFEWIEGAAGGELAPDGVTLVEEIGDEARWREIVGDPALVAFTLITSRDGEILDADVVLNGARFSLAEPPEPRAHVRRTVIAHELGHVLGLGHACGPPDAPGCFGLDAGDPRREALMAASLGPGDGRGPGTDDWAGSAEVAPRSEPASRPEPRTQLIEGAGAAPEVQIGWSPAWETDLVWIWDERSVARKVAPSIPVVVPRGARAVAIFSEAGQGLWLDAPEFGADAPWAPEGPGDGGTGATVDAGGGAWGDGAAREDAAIGDGATADAAAAAGTESRLANGGGCAALGGPTGRATRGARGANAWALGGILTLGIWTIRARRRARRWTEMRGRARLRPEGAVR